MTLSDREIREKMVSSGVGALSNAELLSLLLTEKRETRPAIEVAEQLLSHFADSLVALGRCDMMTLRNKEGLGMNRAAQLAVALELGRRLKADEALMRDVITSNRDVQEVFQPQLSDLPYEEFWILCLSNANRILDRVCISKGGMDGTVVDRRLIVKRALDKLATKIILVHNHPSGNPDPSEEDRLLTKQLAQACSLFDIQLADHVIVTAGECFSFREAHLLDKQLK